MSKPVSSILLTMLFAAPAAAADGPTGAYRLTVEPGDGTSFTALIAFANANNQWTGQFLGGLDLAPQLKPTIRDVRISGDRFRFTLVLAGNQAMTFDGKLPAGRGGAPARGSMAGSIAAGDALVPVTLEPSALAKFDRVGLLKEMVTTGAPGPVFYAAAVDLLRAATEVKAKPGDVKAWADAAAAAAEPFGVRWQIAILLRLSHALADQPGYTVNALELARRAERLLDPAEDVAVQLAVMDLLGRLLRQANDGAGAAAFQARVVALEARDYQDYLAAFPLRPEAYPGRKVKSDRTVLFELFTCAECLPSMAAALAFDALPRVYKPAEVVRLEYHLHTPDPDPLATRASEARWAYYVAMLDKATAATPTAVINGKPGAGGGGPPEFAPAKLKQYRALIDPLLDKPAAAALQLSASRTGDKLTITAKVSGLAKPGDKVRLRVAVAESAVRYTGGNGLRYHQCVVRGFAGSPDGWPLTKPAVEQQATVDVADLRAGLNKDLDEFQKKNKGLVFVDRPLGLRALVVVAFVQDDANQEVLQAAQVEVK